MRTHGGKSHFLENMRNRVAYFGRGRKRKVHYTELGIKPAAGLFCDKLTYARNLKRCFLYDFRNRVYAFALGFGNGVLDDSGPGYAHVDDSVALARAVEGARHERIILHGVTESDEFRAADAVAVAGKISKTFCLFA